MLCKLLGFPTQYLMLLLCTYHNLVSIYNASWLLLKRFPRAPETPPKASPCKYIHTLQFRDCDKDKWVDGDSLSLVPIINVSIGLCVIVNLL